VIVEPGAGRPRHYDQVDVVPECRAVLAVDLTDVTLDAIAYDGTADPARYGASHFPTLTSPPDPIADERVPHPLLPFPVYT